MTGKLSRRHDIVEGKFPDVCPKCGGGVGSFRAVETHFRRSHQQSIGMAFSVDDAAANFEFAFIGPVAGVTRRRWYVVVFAWPFGIVTIIPDEWVIRWKAGTGPAQEGVIT